MWHSNAAASLTRFPRVAPGSPSLRSRDCVWPSHPSAFSTLVMIGAQRITVQPKGAGHPRGTAPE